MAARRGVSGRAAVRVGAATRGRSCRLIAWPPSPRAAATPSSSRRTRRCAAGGWSAARGVSRRAARQARAARAAHLRQQRPHRQDLDLGRILPHLFLRGRRRRVRAGHTQTRAQLAPPEATCTYPQRNRVCHHHFDQGLRAHPTFQRPGNGRAQPKVRFRTESSMRSTAGELNSLHGAACEHFDPTAAASLDPTAAASERQADAPVGSVGVHRPCPHSPQLVSRGTQRASGVDHVVDQDAIAALNLPDQVHLQRKVHRQVRAVGPCADCVLTCPTAWLLSPAASSRCLMIMASSHLIPTAGHPKHTRQLTSQRRERRDRAAGTHLPDHP